LKGGVGVPKKERPPVGGKHRRKEQSEGASLKGKKVNFSKKKKSAPVLSTKKRAKASPKGKKRSAPLHREKKEREGGWTKKATPSSTGNLFEQKEKKKA